MTLMRLLDLDLSHRQATDLFHIWFLSRNTCTRGPVRQGPIALVPLILAAKSVSSVSALRARPELSQILVASLPF